jgi:hypothetical protein
VLVVLSRPPGVLNPDLPRGPALGFTLMLLYLVFNRVGGPVSAVSLPVLLPLCMLNMLRIRDPARADRLVSGGCMNECVSMAALVSPAASASLEASSAARTRDQDSVHSEHIPALIAACLGMASFQYPTGMAPPSQTARLLESAPQGIVDVACIQPQH